MKTVFVADPKVYLCCRNVTCEELSKIRDFIDRLPYTVDMSVQSECDNFYKDEEIVGTIIKDTYVVWLNIKESLLIGLGKIDAPDVLVSRYKDISNLETRLLECMTIDKS